MTDSRQTVLELAEKGRTAYQIQLGQSYLTGRDFDGSDFPQDYSEAMRWLKRAHDQGAFTATYLLGTMYEEGKGVPVDVPAAIVLYEQAVERGAYLPCVNLARIYAQGKGVPQSRSLAENWYRKVLSFKDEVDDVGEMQEAREFLGQK
jgi:uncharacterized protein